MNYYLDTEFFEHEKEITCHGETFSNSHFVNTIELISIGIVSEDGREFYAISKEFDVEAAWDNKWLRENVLKVIFYDYYDDTILFNITEFKKCLDEYGKSRKKIADDIIKFTNLPTGHELKNIESERKKPNPNFNGFHKEHLDWTPIKFYAYYADYDWVIFCWLFGRMIDLPKGYPMFIFDIQQLIVDNQIDKNLLLKEVPQVSCHNALQDATWNKKAHIYIQNILSEKRSD